MAMSSQEERETKDCLEMHVRLKMAKSGISALTKA